jgi:hypothetical protein
VKELMASGGQAGPTAFISESKSSGQESHIGGHSMAGQQFGFTAEIGVLVYDAE